jgi:replicative DNA helicase
VPIAFDERTGMTPSRLRATPARCSARTACKCIVVDYIGLMQADEGATTARRSWARSRARIKRLAKELGLPIIVLAQLNRANESRQDKRPMMSDLRDSGEIEQDADIIVFLHREEYYQPDAPEWKGIAELLVASSATAPSATSSSCTTARPSASAISATHTSASEVVPS